MQCDRNMSIQVIAAVADTIILPQQQPNIINELMAQIQHAIAMAIESAIVV